jgi:hypothetical protein
LYDCCISEEQSQRPIGSGLCVRARPAPLVRRAELAQGPADRGLHGGRRVGGDRVPGRHRARRDDPEAGTVSTGRAGATDAKQAAEFITWGVKCTLDHARDLYLPGYFIASQPRKDRVHITQKPVEVMQQLVRICPEDGTVLDPFTGSGTTGVAALREGRHFVGVELSDHYAAVAERRLQAELTQDDFVLAGPEE